MADVSLRSQRADIAVYLNSFDSSDRPTKLRRLLDLAEQSVPPAAIPSERQLFLQDLKIIIALLPHDV